MNKRIYLIIQVKVQNGEYQYYQHSTHIIEVSNNWNENEIQNEITEYSENHTKTYYPNFTYEDNKTYYFNGGEVATELYSVDKITHSDYEVLSKFLNQ